MAPMPWLAITIMVTGTTSESSRFSLCRTAGVINDGVGRGRLPAIPANACPCSSRTGACQRYLIKTDLMLMFRQITG